MELGPGPTEGQQRNLGSDEGAAVSGVPKDDRHVEEISEIIRRRCCSHADMVSLTTNLMRKFDTNKRGLINRDGFVSTGE